ncbi:putative transglutaminase-like cysteine proteinase [Sphaerotilus hippei]|uniref:Putative transglutaminase-like cysteine proteinase n=1 Tax=Sphaerotilus hippei TaxID=744406 RepID=A0A318H0K6_9BURK|nr:transglutaminase-like cysteine peptidase [Sphaerotilus hippei]PXW94752.1 putative transglutaminase-like cysteine proteinase [Sphaerotilus hippei]
MLRPVLSRLIRHVRPTGACIAGAGARRVLAALALAGVTAAALPSWEPDRQAAQAQRWGAVGVQAVKAYQAVVQQGGGLDDDARMQSVNQFVNRRLNFREDIDAWGVADYWATPVESLGKGQGDCEDYAISKYFALLATGVPAQRLRLVYVRASIGGAGGPQLAHMVLAYYPPSGTEPLILDNLVTEIRTASRRPDLTPVFSFNTDGLWQGAQGGSAGDPVARLSKWRDVLVRVKDEGSF